ELDDRAARRLREEIVEEVAADDLPAFDAGVGILSGEDLDGFLARLCQNRDGFAPPAGRDDILAGFGLPAGFDAPQLVAEVLGPGDPALLRGLVPILAGGSSNNATAASRI